MTWQLIVTFLAGVAICTAVNVVDALRHPDHNPTDKAMFH